jgi:hypothetical protein
MTIYQYSGSQQTWNAPAGTYLLEIWGGSGGSYSNPVATGGYGGYFKGILILNTETTLYIYIGGERQCVQGAGTEGNISGGWNGGGTGWSAYSSIYVSCSGG